jgi:hypothetical protein
MKASFSRTLFTLINSLFTPFGLEFWSVN